MMNTMYKRLSVITTAFMILALTITGCTSQASNIGLAREKDPNAIGTDFVVAEVGSFDSADTAVVVSTDMENGYVTFMNIATGKQYTLSYDGTTYVKDRYESPMSMAQIKEGDIVDITFLKSKKRLASVQLSPDSWVFDNIENYDLGGMNKTATIGSNTYSLPDDAIILSEGRRAELMEIVNKDVLTVSGIDHTIYSVNVERGHGYLRLSNEQALIGGWIEVGNAVVQRITEDMLLAVPEGSYQVLLSNENASCVKEVVIERNKEVVLDASDLEILQNKTGKILISVNPPTASVRVDGELVDISEEVELTYGIHQIRLEAEGYQTMTKYIQVGSEYASISFIMEEGATEDENSVSDNSSVDDIANAVTGNRVYIDAPQGVEAYLDGNYVGITPISFTKVTGDHTITLSKEGYVSKSYTIYLYDDGEDITYSFADLEEDGSTTSSSRRVTSNKSSRTTSNTETNQGNSDSTVSGNSVNKVNTVSIYTNPEGVTVFLDDVFLGVTPFTFTKVDRIIGKHTIKLEKEGYQTFTTPIYFDNNGRDEEITFPALKEEVKQPENPDDTKKPSDSDEDDEKSDPTTPTDPITPDNPDDSNNPENPDNPDDPNNPENPDNPSDPNNPENPDNPDDPNNPESPDNSDDSIDPDNPDNPNLGNTETPSTSESSTKSDDLTTSISTTTSASVNSIVKAAKKK
ncbi:MAG: PEGA domain-containing protein [Clostridium sp.]|nr:PEGA domain-containing protein [Clostridium sp.]